MRNEIRDIVFEVLQECVNDPSKNITGEATLKSLNNSNWDMTEDFFSDVQERLNLKIFYKDWDTVYTVDDAIDLLMSYKVVRNNISKSITNIYSNTIGAEVVNDESNHIKLLYRLYEAIAGVKKIDDKIWNKCKSISDVINLLTQVSNSDFKETRVARKWFWQ